MWGEFVIIPKQVNPKIDKQSEIPKCPSKWSITGLIQYCGPDTNEIITQRVTPVLDELKKELNLQNLQIIELSSFKTALIKFYSVSSISTEKCVFGGLKWTEYPPAWLKHWLPTATLLSGPVRSPYAATPPPVASLPSHIANPQ